MQILYLPPDQDGYRLVEPTDRVLRARLAGGATRSRVDQAESWKQTTVTWTVGPSEYLMLTSFFETATEGGVNHFLCELITDSPVGKLHECHFLPGSRDLGNIRGHTYQFIGQLAVRPQRVDHELNRVILKRYEEDRFADLLNVQIRPIEITHGVFDAYYVGLQPYTIDLVSMIDNRDCLDYKISVDQLPAGLTFNSETNVIETLPGISPNIFDKDSPDIEISQFVLENNGNLASNAIYNATGFIPVIESLPYYVSNMHRFAWYDANENYISGDVGDTNGGAQFFTAPANAAFLRFSYLKTQQDILIAAQSAIAVPFQAFGTSPGSLEEPVSDFLEFPVEVTLNYRLGEIVTTIQMTLRRSDSVGVAGHPVISPMIIGSTFQVG